MEGKQRIKDLRGGTGWCARIRKMIDWMGENGLMMRESAGKWTDSPYSLGRR